MVNRTGKEFIAIWLGCLMPFVYTVQMTCDSNAPALGSNLTCICTDVSLQGVVWWKDRLFLAACSSSGACCPAEDDYEFEVISFPVFYMTIFSYSYANCGKYYCAGFQYSLNRVEQDISISDTPLDLTQQFTLSTPETNSTGNITVETTCLFIPTTTVQESIKAVWYKIVKDTAEIISSDETFIEFEDTCRDCTGVRARKMKATLLYKAPDTIFKGETESVEFVLKIFEQNNELNGQDITTVNKFIIEKTVNATEPRNVTPNEDLNVGEIVGICIGSLLGLYVLIGGILLVITFYDYKRTHPNDVAPHPSGSHSAQVSSMSTALECNRKTQGGEDVNQDNRNEDGNTGDKVWGRVARQRHE